MCSYAKAGRCCTTNPSPTLQWRHGTYRLRLSVLRRDVVLEEVAPHVKADIADVMHSLSVREQLRAHEVSERFYEIGSPQGLTISNAMFEVRELSISDGAVAARIEERRQRSLSRHQVLTIS